MVSVDSVLKKVLFQRHMERTLSFTEFAAVHARGEKLHLLYPGFFDCIVSRAFTELGKFAAMAAPLLVEGGIVIAMKGRGGSGEAADAEVECLRSGLTILEVFEYCLPVSGDQRSLILMGKANGGTGGIQEIE
jgi:16S rRNA (guanine527-N7)-methyltransferase